MFCHLSCGKEEVLIQLGNSKAPFQRMSNDVSCLLQFIILGKIIKGIRDSCCSVPVADRIAPGEQCAGTRYFSSTMRAL